MRAVLHLVQIKGCRWDEWLQNSEQRNLEERSRETAKSGNLYLKHFLGSC